MKTFGKIAFAVLIFFLVYASIMLGASVSGFFGGTLMIVTAIVALLMWGSLAGISINALRFAAGTAFRGTQLEQCLDWTRIALLAAAIMSLVAAFLLAIGAFATCGPVFLAGLYHWGGLAGAAVAFIGYFTLPLIVRRTAGERGDHARPHSWKVIVITFSIVYGIAVLLWLILWLVLRGSIDTGAYPVSSSSPYILPFPGGEASWVIQGNNSSFNHEGNEEHAWDFRRPCGTFVIAARAGTVSDVEDSFTGHGGGKPNNFIEIRHSDNTVARYLHIEQGSAEVAIGDPVGQGSHIANVGNVGNSLTGHIHFVVESSGSSIPISFSNVDRHDGIPRTFRSYTAGN